MVSKFIYTLFAVGGMLCLLIFNVDSDFYIDMETVAIEKYIDDSVSEILDKYPELDNVLTNASIRIPIEDNMIPQGITYMNNNILITAYDGRNKSNSLVYVLDFKGNVINKVDLGNKSHVGGIVYESDNDLIWIPDDNGILNAYNSEDFLVKQIVSPLYVFDDVSEGLRDFENKNKNLIAFLTIKDNHIFIGNFSITEDILVKEFEIVSSDEKVDLKYIRNFKVPAKTQGMTFVKKGDKEYLVLSNSYRRRSKSHIYVFDYNDDTDFYSIDNAKSIILPPLLEQVVVKNNKIYALFESGAKKYNNAIDKIEFICELDIDKMLK